MTLPDAFRGAMRLPAIAAPMFLVSGPELVIETSKAGVAGTFPALNARTAEQLDGWLGEISTALAAAKAADPAAPISPYGINLILHASNPRMESDLALICKHKVPFVITSLGHPGEVVKAVHAYGGLVFSDVIHAYHAKKAIAAGVDGVIAVASGAGGHAGTQSAFSLVREIREFWDGTLILGGAISDGYAVRAAEVLGADFAYMGTRFIATHESYAKEGYKQMVMASNAGDVVYTDAISGTNANFLWPSLEKLGHQRDELVQGVGKGKLKGLADEARAWRDVWSAGHGVATIHDAPPVRELCDRLAEEYRAACAIPPSPAITG
ncbi:MULTISPECIES: nitronate monooxygenase [Zoogloea]|jgi:nitronate monooxygenase|uniref:Nitronate monooxygenase n=1 Tax=Zoogloea oleivorans TaxID=1552750 RepID=A0A6C2CYK2_9RHOO|nr:MULTISPECIES: nitronate monooxygenase [Zoogloea]MBP8134264.1 nitronate monooxygenase [Zoogloea sp.]MDD2667955.1 nitronate monooxygenase [Zoogloea sp.]MDY0035811.1 nitronate monooxygenase [Zoogloea oleivorans]TYC58485.1 nitronate monooxygenase [Zoogloea oleivorans]